VRPGEGEAVTPVEWGASAYETIEVTT